MIVLVNDANRSLHKHKNVMLSDCIISTE